MFFIYPTYNHIPYHKTSKSVSKETSKVGSPDSSGKNFIKINVPGVDPKDLSVELVDHTLTIIVNEAEKGTLRSKSYDLDPSVDLSTVDAEVKYGVLKVSWAMKSQEDVKRVIKVRS